MVRYSAEHKARSRAAIIEAAARLFRTRGYRGVGIDEVCQAAGLTRGTFYAHFRSKLALLRAVMAGSHDFVRRLKARRGDVAHGAARVAEGYLETRNRRGVLGGCSLAALAMDTVRADAGTQAAYADAVRQVVAEFEREHPSVSPADARAALALCVGGLLIAGACGSDPIGDQVANAARKHVRALLEVRP